MPDRRTFLQAVSGAAVASALPGCRRETGPKWDAAAFVKPEISEVAILGATGYDGDLRDAVVRGIRLCGLDPLGRRVLLKPNLVEFDPAGVINTHPALIAATIEAFRALGAAKVIVGEGPGHRRDNRYLLDASGIGYVLRDTGSRYVDLNADDVRPVSLRSRYTRLGRLYLPRTLLDADLLVSMPKLKTHHWAGVTLSLKNMFGVVPGGVYGWPKNVLHWEGISASILDINAALDLERFTILDGIVGMEGNGPIQGTARYTGALVFGNDPVAVDATCSRLMEIDPERVAYLKEADRFLGNISPERIRQVADEPGAFVQEYEVIESFAYLRAEPEVSGS